MTDKTEGAAGWLRPSYLAIPQVLSWIASFAILFIMLLICADIVMRAGFSRPINGATEIVSMLIVVCVFLQLGSSIGEGRLVKADFLYGRWSGSRPAFAAVIDVIGYAIGAFILAKGLIWLWNDFYKSYQSAEFMGAVGAYTIPVWPFSLGVVIGCAVALAETIRVLCGKAAPIIGVFGGRGERSLVRDGLPTLALAAAILLFVYVNFSLGLTPLGVGFVSLAALLACVALGVPIAFALLGLSYIGIWLTRDNPIIADNTVGITFSGAIKSYEFGVVPLFVMMGLILDKADVGRDAFYVAVSMLRKIRGGLGIATVGANAVFASITGSSIASAAVFSRIAVPPMIENGYTKRFAVGVVAGSSVLGMLIPPSLLLIIYGLIAEVSIGKLFIAAIVPGLILAAAFAALNYGLATFWPSFVGKVHDDIETRMSGGEMARRLLPVVAIVALVMGGIYAGFFTPTEAGAVGTFCAFIVGFARGKLSWPVLRSVVLETGYVSTTILFLIIAANVYARMLTLSTIPMEMTGILTDSQLGLAQFLAIYFVLVLLLGMLLDSTSIMLIMLPIVIPIVSVLGGDLIWFGIVTVLAIEIGLITPPFGIAVFVVKGSFPPNFVSLGEIFAGALPFVLTMMAVTILLMAVPWLSLMFM
ncbi:TRAP transporter large permease subunit [Pseudoxanthobacter sp. M-2]|uniref:TRAP transporter large permease subunit n=1 Tax=Pseudoxanthobacter sp. M-2 TaxID=3078754 RepID=UPI0038FCD11E